MAAKTGNSIVWNVNRSDVTVFIQRFFNSSPPLMAKCSNWNITSTQSLVISWWVSFTEQTPPLKTARQHLPQASLTLTASQSSKAEWPTQNSQTVYCILDAMMSCAIYSYISSSCMHAVWIPVPDETRLSRNHGRTVIKFVQLYLWWHVALLKTTAL